MGLDLKKVADTAISTEGQGMFAAEVLALARDWLRLSDELAHYKRVFNQILEPISEICALELRQMAKANRTTTPEAKERT